MKLSLRDGLERLTQTLSLRDQDKFVIRILSCHKPHGDYSPIVYSFFYECNKCTTSLGICSRQANGVQATKNFKDLFPKVQLWSTYLPIAKQFILTEHHKYSGAILTAETHKAYTFTGSLFTPLSSDTITSLAAPNVIELRNYYAKLT